MSVIQEHIKPTNGWKVSDLGHWDSLGMREIHFSTGDGWPLPTAREIVTKSQYEHRVFCQRSRELGCLRGQGHVVGL